VAWTVNDPDRIVALARMGVDAVVTDDPGRAREALATLNTP
jgi:glycerophosphoryl diester phosphodiesterase